MWHETAPFHDGSASSHVEPLPLTKTELAAERKRLRDRLTRRRPAGFTAIWPEDTTEQGAAE